MHTVQDRLLLSLCRCHNVVEHSTGTWTFCHHGYSVPEDLLGKRDLFIRFSLLNVEAEKGAEIFRQKPSGHNAQLCDCWM
ncbi:unnamed protein product, partial [Sphagnum troendelagicum]